MTPSAYLPPKRRLGEKHNLGRMEAEAQEVVEEEVVELVGSYKVLGLLSYLSVVVGRCELRRDWCVDNVEQHSCDDILTVVTVTIGSSLCCSCWPQTDVPLWLHTSRDGV